MEQARGSPNERWHITPAGLYCRTWIVTDGGRERCFHVYPDGETFAFYVNDRWTVERWTRTRGPPGRFLVRLIGER